MGIFHLETLKSVGIDAVAGSEECRLKCLCSRESFGGIVFQESSEELVSLGAEGCQ